MYHLPYSTSQTSSQPYPSPYLPVPAPSTVLPEQYSTYSSLEPWNGGQRFEYTAPRPLPHVLDPAIIRSHEESARLQRDAFRTHAQAFTELDLSRQSAGRGLRGDASTGWHGNGTPSREETVSTPGSSTSGCSPGSQLGWKYQRDSRQPLYAFYEQGKYYPTREELAGLANQSGLSVEQVAKWYVTLTYVVNLKSDQSFLFVLQVLKQTSTRPRTQSGDASSPGRCTPRVDEKLSGTKEPLQAACQVR